MAAHAQSGRAEQAIQCWLVTASREIENYEKYDYILVNDRLEESVDALKSILLAERLQLSGTQMPKQTSTADAETDSKGRPLSTGKCAGAVATDFGFVRASGRADVSRGGEHNEADRRV